MHNMRIFTKKPIESFKVKHPDSATGLQQWYVIVSKSKFDGPEHVRKVFGNKVDIVAKGYVFDISGNKYRLAASIHFNKQHVFIREIMTHAEYSKEAWKKRHQDFH
jgi:mRNA interferase HigB